MTDPSSPRPLVRRRPRAVAEKRISQNDTRIGLLLYPEPTNPPRTRADCPTERPCAYVSCRYNLYLDVTEAGSVVAPDREPWEQPPRSSCALDVAAEGGATLAEVAEILGVTRERVRQIEVAALEKSRRLGLRLSGGGREDVEGRTVEVWERAPQMPALKGDGSR